MLPAAGSGCFRQIRIHPIAPGCLPSSRAEPLHSPNSLRRRKDGISESTPDLERPNFIGVIFIFRNYPDLFTLNDKKVLRAFADQAAIAVYNAQLYGQVS
jgi:GAF domain-containing protein